MAQDNRPSTGPGSKGLSEAPTFWPGQQRLLETAGVTALASRIAAAQRAEVPATLKILLLGEDAEEVLVVRDLLERIGPDRYLAHWLHEIPLTFPREGAGWDAVIIACKADLGVGLAHLTALRAAGLGAPVLLVAAGVEEDGIARAVDLGAGDVLEAIDLDAHALDRGVRNALTRHIRDRRLHHAARRDDLTGLANRASFRDRLDHALTLAKRGDGKLALLLIDLNDFKAINDRFGHPGGDELLRRIGERMRSRVRESDTVARLGGDEFAVLLPNIVRPEDAAVVVRKLIEAIRPVIDLDGQSAQVTASIGVAIFPDHAQDAGKLERLADAAMYRAKRLEGGGCCWHDATRQIASPEAEDLIAAFASDAIRFKWRPQIGLQPSRIAVGIRPVWSHARMGALDLLPMRVLIEEAGLIEELTDRLLVASLNRLSAWRLHGYDRVIVSMPVMSRRRLAWISLADRMAEALHAHDIPANRLEVEIDEQLLIDDLSAGGVGAAAFARSGVSVAIDRFGDSGAAIGLFTSPWAKTVRFGSDALDVQGGSNRLQLFQTAINFAHGLEIQTVATGADDRQRMSQARSLGIRSVESSLGNVGGQDLCLPWLQVATRRIG